MYDCLSRTRLRDSVDGLTSHLSESTDQAWILAPSASPTQSAQERRTSAEQKPEVVPVSASCLVVESELLPAAEHVHDKDDPGRKPVPDAVGIGKSLVALHYCTFLLGPGFVVGIGNGLLPGYLMYRSALVPLGMAVLRLVGGPLVIASGVAILFGVFEAGSMWQAIATIPEFFWELSLGIWLIVKGFNPSVIASEKFGLRFDEPSPEIEGVAPVPAP
jgi:hypothetical protein